MRTLLLWCFVALALTSLPFSAWHLSAARADSEPAARQGCVDQWMFNGLWRVRVTKVDPLNNDDGKQIGWLVTEVWRNGTARTWSPGDTFYKGQHLVLANGSTITTDETTIGTLSAQDVYYHGFPPAAQYTHQQRFIASGPFDPTVKPAHLMVLFDATKQAGRKDAPQYSVTPPNYDIKLDCTATAAQQAQGGAYQVAAKQGCINQWLSNGLWKMRVTKVDPEMDSGKQIGWLVSQQWNNIQGHKASPGFLEDEQLVISNEDTISSGETTVTTLQYQQLSAHTYDPGETHTHVQNFRRFRPAFDPAQTPVKLLVIFNEDSYKYFIGKPMPVNPPNFRILLTCTK